MNIFLCRLKVFLRDKGILFWTMIFPLGLSIFFYLGFGTIDFFDAVKSSNLYIITEEKYYIGQDMENVLKELEYEDSIKIFEIKYIDTLSKADFDFSESNIDNYFYIDEGEYKLSSSNPNISIMVETVITKYENLNFYIKEKMKVGETDVNKLINEFFSGTSNSYIKANRTIDNTKFATIYFYALISMICLFASQLGIRIVTDVRADNSDIGIRAGITPTKRSKMLGIYFIVAFLFESIGSTILILFIKYILKIEFGNMLLVLLTSYLGNIVGLTFGMMVAALFKGDRTKKENSINAIAMLSCFFAGLMVYNVKHMLDKALGIFAKLNPATPIVDSLFCLYFYSDYNKYLIDIAFMVGLSVVFFMIVVFKMRGEKYESL